MNSMKSRKVRVYENRNTPGTRDWTKEVRAESAIFHGFGSDYEEFETGAGNYAVAICELHDGSVIMPRADMVEFLPKPKRTSVIVYVDGVRLFQHHWFMITTDRVEIVGPLLEKGSRVGVVAGFDDGSVAQFCTDGLPGVVASGTESNFKVPGYELAKEIE